MSTLKILVSDVLSCNSRETLLEYASYIADVNSLSRFYLLTRRIKELRKMIAQGGVSVRVLLCWRQDMLLMEAIHHRLGELELSDIKRSLSDGGKKQPQ